MTIQSMTGFGRSASSAGVYGFAVEVRSVNHKFCEVRTRLPGHLAVLESRIAGLVRDRLERGFVDVTVRIEGAKRAVGKPVVNRPLAEAYGAAWRELAMLEHSNPTPPIEWLAAQPDVLAFHADDEDIEAQWNELHGALDTALQRLTVMRGVEGAALATDLEERLAAIEAHTAEIRARAPTIAPMLAEKLNKKLDALIAKSRGDAIDPSRLAHEAALLAERADIEEEVTRLSAHCAQFRTALASNEPVGRTLDFLTQEINREANTIASKSPDLDVTRLAMALKSEIERVREQVQNVR